MSANGPLAEKVLAYVDAITVAVPTARTAEDFAAVADFLDVDEFERVGTFLEVQDWPTYAAFLAGWASSIDTFESHTRRISEVDDLVFYETEERHFHGDSSTVLNSLSVFAYSVRQTRELFTSMATRRPALDQMKSISFDPGVLQ